MTKKLIVANWKMNPESLEEASSLVQKVTKKLPKNVNLVICPPFVFLAPLFKSLKSKKVSLGAQNIFMEKKGAYTGEVSGAMLNSLGASYVIVGHSERRMRGESDEEISKKIMAARNSNLTPIICIGESARDEQGHYLQTLKSQILASLSLLPKTAINEVVIAYEPIWAIGVLAKGVMNPRDLHETSIFVRKVLIDAYGSKAKETKILYGGSVSPLNAADLVKEGQVDGLLVGHASLDIQTFGQIITSVSTAK